MDLKQSRTTLLSLSLRIIYGRGSVFQFFIKDNMNTMCICCYYHVESLFMGYSVVACYIEKNTISHWWLSNGFESSKVLCVRAELYEHDKNGSLSNSVYLKKCVLAQG